MTQSKLIDFHDFLACEILRKLDIKIITHLLVLLHYLAKLETQKSHLFTIILCCTLQDFNQSLFDYFNLVDLQHIFILMYDSLNLIINGVHLSAVGGGT